MHAWVHTWVHTWVNAGIKVKSIVSYNHLGNNDGKNLSQPDMFRSKEISKSNVVDDMVPHISYPHYVFFATIVLRSEEIPRVKKKVVKRPSCLTLAFFFCIMKCT